MKQSSLVAVFLILLQAVSAHAVTLNEAQVNAIKPIVHDKCMSKRDKAKWLDDAGFEKLCGCSDAQALAGLRSANWDNPDNPSAADIKQSETIRAGALQKCIKQSLREDMARRTTEACHSGKDYYVAVAKLQPEARNKACECVGQGYAGAVFVKGDELAYDKSINKDDFLPALTSACVKGK